MNTQSDQQERLTRISQLMTLHDDFQTVERTLAGLANAYGFAMVVPERNRQAINILEWVKASLSPVSAFAKSITAVLEYLRKEQAVKAGTKKWLAVAEALLFWGKVAYDIATGYTPVGLPKVATTLLLKAASLRCLRQAEALEKAMDYYWRAAYEYRQFSPILVEELNREIDGLR